MTNPIDLLLSRLDRPKPSGKGYICRCPAHDDRSPSLNVSEASDGRVLIHCFGGCRADDVIAAVGLEWKDLFLGTLDSEARREYRRQSATQAKKDAELVLKIRDAAPFMSESDERYFETVEAQHRQASQTLTELAASAAPVAAVEPPTIDIKAPLKVARLFVGMNYSAANVDTLHYWRSDWYVWQGSHYEIATDDMIRSQVYVFLEGCLHYVKEMLEGVKPNAALVNEVISALRATQLIELEDPPSWIVPSDIPASDIIPCRNGFLLISTRRVIPATPELFVTASLEFDAIENPAHPTEWLAFLDRIWEADEQSKQCLAEAFGYMLTDATDQQKAFMLVGPKRSGKGTILRILELLVGRHNKVSPSFNSLGSQFGLQPLIGKRIAMISDARLSHRADQAAISENILRITGEDTVSVDRKFREPWNGKLPTKFVVATNELPSFSDASAALASRFLIFRFIRSFFGEEDFGLTDRLTRELPGILMWALDGLVRLRGRGRLVQPIAGRELADELEEMTSPIMQFIDDCCHVAAAVTVPVPDLFAEWKKWCTENGRDHPGTVQSFGKMLTAASPTIRKTQRRNQAGAVVRVYEGVRIRAYYDA